MTRMTVNIGGEVRTINGPRAKRSKPKVNHLVMTKELVLANEMGVDVRSICGVWVKPWSLKPHHVVQVDGPNLTNITQRDCGNCARIDGARARRVWERQQRG